MRGETTTRWHWQRLWKNVFAWLCRSTLCDCVIQPWGCHTPINLIWFDLFKTSECHNRECQTVYGFQFLSRLLVSGTPTRWILCKNPFACRSFIMRNAYTAVVESHFSEIIPATGSDWDEISQRPETSVWVARSPANFWRRPFSQLIILLIDVTWTHYTDQWNICFRMTSLSGYVRLFALPVRFTDLCIL